MRYLTAKQVADWLGVSVAHLYRLQKNGFPQSVRLGPATVRWSEDEIMRWLETAPRGASGVCPRTPHPAAR